MLEENTFVGDLQKGDEQSENYNYAWSQLFRDPAMAWMVPENQRLGVLREGSKWQGPGWNTTTAAQNIRQVSGKVFVASQWEAYRDCLLFALALVWGLEVSTGDLTDTQSEAAFAIYDRVTNEAAPMQPEQADGDDFVVAPWDTEQL